MRAICYGNNVWLNVMTMMALKFILLSFIGCACVSCGSSQGDAVVYSSDTLEDLTLHLRQDEFTIYFKNSKSIVTLTGSIRKLNDTLYFTYDSKANMSKSAYREVGGFVSIGELFSNKYALPRPVKLLIQGRQLLYLDPISNQPLLAEDGSGATHIFLRQVP